MTMRLPMYQVDAFTDRVFGGNPAAVVVLESWLADQTLQSIAAENNLAETAFLVAGANAWQLRWFTPVAEIDLCGHATLASAQVVFAHLWPNEMSVGFDTRSGRLTVRREGELLVMDFPARPATPCEPPPGLEAILGAAPREVAAARDLLCVYDTADQVRALRPDFAAIARLDTHAVIATGPGGPGDDCDFVSRFFAPKMGVPEDPVTGSAHCTLVPYWSKRLGRTELRARQLSPRGGQLVCRDLGARIQIAGRAAPFLEGAIRV